MHPVHEAAHTYSAPARESLINPIIHKPSVSQSPYLSQQPRYVYVQAGPPQVSSSSGIVTYGQPQHSAENTLQQQQNTAQDDVSYASVEQNQISDSSPQLANAPSRQPSRVLQYFPYISQTP